MKQFRVALVVGLVAVSARGVIAQEMNRIAIDFSMGSGPHTERVRDTWFRKPHSEILRAGGAVRLMTLAHRFAALARIDLFSGGMADQLADCPPAPNGSCRRYFPKTDGVASGVGVLSSLTSRGQVETTAGFLHSTDNHYFAVSASYRVVEHVAALVDWRYFDLAYVAGDRISFRPWQFGVRFF